VAESDRRGFVAFSKKVGIVCGAALAVVTLSGMVVKATTETASEIIAKSISKAVAEEIHPLVERLEAVEVSQVYEIAYTRAAVEALRLPPGSPDRFDLLGKIDTIDTKQDSIIAAIEKRKTKTK
jgi:hypothetical protein